MKKYLDELSADEVEVFLKQLFNEDLDDDDDDCENQDTRGCIPSQFMGQEYLYIPHMVKLEELANTLGYNGYPNRGDIDLKFVHKLAAFLKDNGMKVEVEQRLISGASRERGPFLKFSPELKDQADFKDRCEKAIATAKCKEAETAAKQKLKMKN